MEYNNEKIVSQQKIPEYQKTQTVTESIMSGKLVSSSAVSKSSPATQLPDEVWDILTFMDTGGQPQYISMLPAVNSFCHDHIYCSQDDRWKKKP